MDLLKLPLNSLTVSVADGIDTPATFCRVAKIEIKGLPLKIAFKCTVATPIQNDYKQHSFFAELDSSQISAIQDLEQLFMKKCPITTYELKSCIIEETLIRIKLPVSQTGRKYLVDFSNRFVSPLGCSALVGGMEISLLLIPQFWFMNGQFGLFFKTISLDF